MNAVTSTRFKNLIDFEASPKRLLSHQPDAANLNLAQPPRFGNSQLVVDASLLLTRAPMQQPANGC